MVRVVMLMITVALVAFHIKAEALYKAAAKGPCPSGYATITSEAECKTAAEVLSMPTNPPFERSESGFMTGCRLGSGNVYFNDGAGSNDYGWLCKSTTVVTTTTTNTTTSTNATTTSSTTTSTTSSTTTTSTTTTTKKAAAPTTNVTNVTTNVTNVTNAGGSTTTFTGKLTVSLNGVNKTQMETATKATFAAQFGVAASTITVTATESRRLSDFRNLVGSWSIDYSFTVPTSQAAVVEAKVAAVKTSPDAMKAVFKAQLLAAGVSQTEVEAMAITGFTVTKTVSEASSTKKKPAFSSPSMRHFLSIGITTIAIMSLMFGRLMIGDA